MIKEFTKNLTVDEKIAVIETLNEAIKYDGFDDKTMDLLRSANAKFKTAFDALKQPQRTFTEAEMFFVEDCISEGVLHSDIENVEALGISVLRKIKQV